MTLYMEYQKYHQEGVKEGLQRGRREGRREGLIAMARSLLALNVPLDVIEKSSGMTREEILTLQTPAAKHDRR